MGLTTAQRDERRMRRYLPRQRNYWCAHCACVQGIRCCLNRLADLKREEGEGALAGHPRPLFPGMVIWHGGTYSGVAYRHQGRPVALVSPRARGSSACCCPDLQTRPRVLGNGAGLAAAT